MSTRDLDPKRPLLLLGTGMLLLMLLGGCSRDAFSITSVDVKPLVVATYGAGVGSTLGEGAVIVVQGHPLQADSVYDIAVLSPDGMFRWEKTVRPFQAGGTLHLGVGDVMLPPDIPLPAGMWHVELYTPEGLRVVESFDYHRSEHTLTQAHLDVATVEEMRWEFFDDTWHLIGVGDERGRQWQYHLYDEEGIEIATFGSDAAVIDHPLIQDTTVRERTTMITSMCFDEHRGVYLMIRQMIT